MRKDILLFSVLAIFSAVSASVASAQTKQSDCVGCVKVIVTAHNSTGAVNHAVITHRKAIKRTLNCIGCVGVNLYTSTSSTPSQGTWVPLPPPDTDCTPHQGVDDAIDEVRSEGGSDYWVIGVRCNDGKEFIYEKVYIGPSPNPVLYLFGFADYSDSGTGDSVSDSGLQADSTEDGGQQAEFSNDGGQQSDSSSDDGGQNVNSSDSSSSYYCNLGDAGGTQVC